MAATFFLACSSEGALNASYQVAYYTAAFAGIALCASIIIERCRGGFSWLAICAAAVVLHPAWRLGYNEILDGWRAVSSDCGYGNRFLSVAVLLTTVSVLLVVLFRPALSRRFFLLVLTSACWCIHIGNFLFWRMDFFRNGIPPALSTNRFIQELIMTVDFGQMRLIGYTLILTVICMALYIPWHRLRGQ